MTADRRDREYRHRIPCNYHENNIRNAQQGYPGTLSGHHGESVGASDDTKKSGPEDRNVSLPAGPNMDGWDSGATPRDATGWLSSRSMWEEIALFFRRFFCRSCRRRSGGRAGLRAVSPMIPGELDEGIKEVVCDLEAALFHLCGNLRIPHGTHVFLHVAQELLADADALT